MDTVADLEYIFLESSLGYEAGMSGKTIQDLRYEFYTNPTLSGGSGYYLEDLIATGAVSLSTVPSNTKIVGQWIADGVTATYPDGVVVTGNGWTQVVLSKNPDNEWITHVVGASISSTLEVPTVTVTGTTSDSITISTTAPNGIVASSWEYSLDSGAATLLASNTISGIGSGHSGTVKVRYFTSSSGPSPWSNPVAYTTGNSLAYLDFIVENPNNVDGWVDNSYAPATRRYRGVRTVNQDGSTTVVETEHYTGPDTLVATAPFDQAWIYSELALQGDGTVVLPFTLGTPYGLTTGDGPYVRWAELGDRNNGGNTLNAPSLFNASGNYGLRAGPPYSPPFVGATVTVNAGISFASGDWLKLDRQGDKCSFFVSKNSGTSWSEIGFASGCSIAPLYVAINGWAYTLTSPYYESGNWS